MKVSQDQKTKIRQKLLLTAVSLFTKRSFADVTMREISSVAGFSQSTIYSYFPSKEAIFFAYFEDKQEELLLSLKDVDGFASFHLKEKLQMLLEMQLDMYLPERVFVAAAFKALLDSPMRSFTELQPVKDCFAAEVGNYLSCAANLGEIKAGPYDRFISNLFWEYKNLIVLFWLKDGSEGFSETSRLIDMSLDIYVDVIRSGIITKGADIFFFLIKSHLYGNIGKLYELMGLFGGFSRSADTNGNHS
jgi:AcrR family transcriptional regulator